MTLGKDSKKSFFLKFLNRKQGILNLRLFKCYNTVSKYPIFNIIMHKGRNCF